MTSEIKDYGIINIVPEADKSNIKLIKTLYHYGNKDTDYIDAMDVVYKNVDTGEKFVKRIDEPQVSVYVPLPGKEQVVTPEHMALSDVKMVMVPYRNREMAIAHMLGGNTPQMVADAYRSSNRRAAMNVHKEPNIVGSDYTIDQWYNIQWYLNMRNNKELKIDKAAFDIEVDLALGGKGKLEDALHPINAVTLIDMKLGKVYTQLLRNKTNPQIDEFEDKIDEFIEELHRDFDEVYGKLDYSIFMYDRETELIKDFALLTKAINADFMMVWNMDFDIPYVLKRAEMNGMDVNTLFYDEKFSRPRCSYKKSRTFDVEKKASSWNVSLPTVFIDQMALYGATRITKGAVRSYALNDVGKDELGDEKIDYSTETNIKKFPYDNYWKFVKYNIKDVLLQVGIENKVNDIDALYIRSMENAVPYDQAFKQTKFLDTRSYRDYFEQGYIIGNNVNMDYDTPYGEEREKTGSEDDDKYDGGLVANPNLNDYIGIEVGGMRSKHVFGTSVVYDAKAMYPSIYRAWNVSRTTMIGKVLIDETEETVLSNAAKFIEAANSGIDVTDVVHYDNGTRMLDDYTTGNNVQFCKDWFGLPSIEEMDELIDIELNVLGTGVA